MTAPADSREAADDRRFDRALFGDHAADADLPPEWEDEFATLAADLADVPDGEGPPPHLVEAVRADAGRFFASPAVVEPAGRVGGGRSHPPVWRVLALAAAVVVSFGLGMILRPSVTTGPAGTVAQRVAASPDAQSLTLTTTDDTAALPDRPGGSVAWSDAEQAGVLTLTGLAANDPAESQYQLWIFDAERDERYPVDGGVFDVTGPGTRVVFTPAVPVSEATMFAVTVERPGGVVVSDRSRLPAVATVGES